MFVTPDMMHLEGYITYVTFFFYQVYKLDLMMSETQTEGHKTIYFKNINVRL